MQGSCANGEDGLYVPVAWCYGAHSIETFGLMPFF